MWAALSQHADHHLILPSLSCTLQPCFASRGFPPPPSILVPGPGERRLMEASDAVATASQGMQDLLAQALASAQPGQDPIVLSTDSSVLVGARNTIAGLISGSENSELPFSVPGLDQWASSLSLTQDDVVDVLVIQGDVGSSPAPQQASTSVTVILAPQGGSGSDDLGGVSWAAPAQVRLPIPSGVLASPERQLTYGCGYRDVSSGEWKSSGLVLLGFQMQADGSGAALCATTHLTEFAGQQTNNTATVGTAPATSSKQPLSYGLCFGVTPAMGTVFYMHTVLHSMVG
jgi:hypothetical protein